VSEGLARGPYVAARAGVEFMTLRTKGVDSTNAPHTPHHVPSEQYRYGLGGHSWRRSRFTKLVKTSTSGSICSQRPTRSSRGPGLKPAGPPSEPIVKNVTASNTSPQTHATPQSMQGHVDLLKPLTGVMRMLLFM